MNKALRWRILGLQGAMIVILAFCAGILYVGGTFVHTTIHDELASQQIFFPPAGSPGLNPKEFADLQQYAGQQVLDGDTARAYANGFIGRHVAGIAGGKTYAQVSGAALKDPTNLKLAGQAGALFKGETLRGLLLNAYAWWQVGQYALYAGLGLGLASGLVWLAFLWEAFFAPRTKKQEVVLAPTRAAVRSAA